MIKSPCVGICSTTSLGDIVCRGCTRSRREVIDWNRLHKEDKVLILTRLEQNIVRAASDKLIIIDQDRLSYAVKRYGVPHSKHSPKLCWALRLLNKRFNHINADEFGLSFLDTYASLPPQRVVSLINKEILTLAIEF